MLVLSHLTSYLWSKTQVRSLRINMRVYLKDDAGGEELSNLRLQIGDGNMHKKDGKANISRNTSMCALVKDINILSEKVYPNLKIICIVNITWLKERAIQTLTNNAVASIKNSLLDQLPTEVVKYQSVDSFVEVDDVLVKYLMEFLLTLNPPGVPPYNLCLKV